jgi:hypothetical protein
MLSGYPSNIVPDHEAGPPAASASSTPRPRRRRPLRARVGVVHSALASAWPASRVDPVKISTTMEIASPKCVDHDVNFMIAGNVRGWPGVERRDPQAAHSMNRA